MSTDELREVAPEGWHDAVAAARAGGFSYFDWLSAVDRSYDEAAPGDDVVLRLIAFPRHDPVVGEELTHFRALRLTTRVATGAPLASVTDVYAGAAWHERETHEMFGIDIVGHPYLLNLYLPGEFEGHPLRKDFPLLARHVKPWPGIVDVEPMPASDEEAEAEATETEEAAE